MANEGSKNSNNTVNAKPYSNVHIGDGLDEEQSAELVGEKFDEKFDKQNKAQVSIARRNLVESGKKLYPSFTEIMYCCNRLISLVGYIDDQVTIYSAICSKNVVNINNCIQNINIDFNRTYLFDDIFFIVRSIESKRNFDAVKDLLKRYRKIDAPGYVKLEEAFAERKTIIENGIENLNLNFDVFVTYASEDLSAVKEIVDFLESSKGGSLLCFYAERNLPKDADNFWDNIYSAMRHSKVLLFVSSANSRNNDNVLQEIAGWGEQENSRNRVEYLLSPYGRNLNAREKTVKENFPNKWYSSKKDSKGDLAKRIIALVSDYNFRRSTSESKTILLPQEVSATKEVGEETVLEEDNEEKKEQGFAITIDGISEKNVDTTNKYFDICEDGSVDSTEQLKYVEGESKDIILPNGVEEIEDLQQSDAEKTSQSNYPTLQNFDSNEFKIDGTELIKYTGKANIVKIPYGVTSIGGSAFSYCVGLTSITIPNSVTSIGYGAFSDCYFLTSITIPDSVTSIEACAFRACSRLTSVVIPDSVTSIRHSAFRDCSRLTSVVIPDSVTSIGDSAFHGCSSLQYNEYDNAYYLGNDTNKYVALIKAKDTFVTSCIIHENAKVIASHAFLNCGGLTSITLPDSVASIGYEPFENCSKLQYNEYDNAYYLGNNTNPYVALIKTKDNSIKSCLICENTKIIYHSAFYNCSNLAGVTIPSSVISIHNYAFEGCSGLTSITVTNGNTMYHSAGNCLIETASKTLILGCKNSVIPIDGSVTSIGSGAFSGCRSLTNITIPSSVTSIGHCAFSGCESLTNMMLPNSVTSIGVWAFCKCRELTGMTIPDSVTRIGGAVFDGCDKLQYNKYGNAYYLGNDMNPYVALIKTKDRSITACMINANIKVIVDGAFSGCDSLTIIKIPNGVMSIGRDAFDGCKNVHIFCEAESKPDGWAENWNAGRPVSWGVKRTGNGS